MFDRSKPPAPPDSAPPTAEAMALLARRGNPFRQQFARNSDDPVCSLYHVEGVFESERSILQEFVESYRAEPMKATSVLPLLGPRGAGKTHLLHNIKHRPGVPPQLFITPGTFRTDAGAESSFLEYVLYQFINVLLAGAEQRGVRPLVYVGEHLTRHALVEALSNATEELAPRRRWPLGGGAARPSSDLLERLRIEPRPCRLLVKESGADVEQLLKQTSEALEKREPRDLKGAFRRRVTEGFVRATLLGDESDLSDFLTDGFADVRFVVKPTRTQLTLSMLQALVELIVGSGIPVAAGFDQLEELLYGQTDAEVRRASDAFFGGLVQLMSQCPGLGVLLFVEEGLWNRIVPPLPSHILDRIHEPVHLPSHGTVRTVRLKTPTIEQLTAVVACRVRKTLHDLPGVEALPAEFPFDRSYLQELVRKETVLRLMLQGCCNRLDDLLTSQPAQAPTPTKIGNTPAEPAPPPTVKIATPDEEERLWDELRDRWSQDVRAAERKLKPVGSLSAATAEIHGGLGRWLQVCRMLGVEQDDWKLVAVRDHVQVGDHPVYGALTVLEWRNEAGDIRNLGVGLWLGRGVGKPRDLEAKLAVFKKSPAVVDHLILFRPNDDLRLSGRSQSLWDESLAQGFSLRLEGVEIEGLAKLHAFPAWMQQLQESFPNGSVPEHAYVFLAEQTEDVMLRLGLPTESTAATA
jgi:hypothetical protein